MVMVVPSGQLRGERNAAEPLARTEAVPEDHQSRQDHPTADTAGHAPELLLIASGSIAAPASSGRRKLHESCCCASWA